MSKERRLVLMTNLPGSGKSTLGRAIAEASNNRGITAEFIDEFAIIGKWFSENITQSNLIKKEYGPDDGSEGHLELTAQGYEEMFNYATVEIIRKFTKSTATIIIAESARNIGGMDYESFFGPLIEALGDQADFVNLNVIVSDPEVQRRRLRKRTEEENANAASITIFNMYLAEVGNYQSSIEAATHHSEFIMNENVWNDGTKEDARQTVNGLLGQIIAGLV